MCKSVRSSLIYELTNIHEEFEPIKKLGEGSFGTAQLVRERATGQQRVLKAVRKDGNLPPQALAQEVTVLKELDHPNVIRIFGFFEDVRNMYILMEPADGGELLQVIKELYEEHELSVGESWMAKVISQCLSALAYCHERDVVHKDLKAENIMLLNVDRVALPHAVIIDFGVSEMLKLASGGAGRKNRLRASTRAGTCTTMAPEVWSGDFGAKVDIWSLGCVLFQILSGTLPFLARDLNNGAEWQRLQKEGPNWAHLSHVSMLARQICQKMLTFDERMRPTALQCLRHNWFVAGQEAAAVPLDKDALQALCSLHSQNVLTQALSLKLATSLNSTAVEHLTQLFQSCDADHNGVLSGEELAAAFRSAGVDEAAAHEVVKSFPVHACGMSYTHFLAATLASCHKLLDELLWTEFSKLDKEHTGSLSREELREVLQAVGCAAQTERVLREVDSSKDGRIQYDELLNYLNFPRFSELALSKQRGHGGSETGLGATQEVSASDAASDIDLLIDQLDNEGLLTSDAVATAVPSSRKASTVPQDVVEALFQHESRHGVVHPQEFAHWATALLRAPEMAARSHVLEEAMLMNFEAFDTNRDGKLDKSEWEELLGAIVEVVGPRAMMGFAESWLRTAEATEEHLPGYGSHVDRSASPGVEQLLKELGL